MARVGERLMRQVARRLGDGRLELVDVPEPVVGPGEVAVRVEASVLSAGTERAKLDVARKNLLAKARARPDQARQVLERVRTDGLASTARLVRHRLAGARAARLQRRRTCAPGGWGRARPLGRRPGRDRRRASANHAEVDVVPSLLCARIPDGVAAEEAAFATLGAIAMHGFRRGELRGRVHRRGRRPRSDRPARRSNRARRRLSRARRRPEAGAGRAGRAAGAEGVARQDLDGTTRWDEIADAVLICAADPEHRSRSSSRRGWRATARRWSSSVTSRWRSRGPRTTRRSSTCGSRAPTARGATTPTTRSTATTTRSATSAGPSSAT